MIIKKLTYPMMDENTYIITGEKSSKAIIIDPSVKIDIIENYLVQNDLSLEYIILTHGHVDHILTVNPLKEKYKDIKIIAYFDEKELLENSRLNLSSMFGMGDIEVDADIFVSDEETLETSGLNLKIMHTPGHTKGSMCIFVGEKVLMTGDTLFQGSMGRTDFPTGSHTDMINSLRKLKNLEDDITIYPGHGTFSTIGKEKKYNMFMSQV